MRLLLMMVIKGPVGTTLKCNGKNKFMYSLFFFVLPPSIVKAGVSSENRDDRQDGLSLSQTGSEDGLMGQCGGPVFASFGL